MNGEAERSHGRLGRELVFDNYIAAQQRIQPDAHATQYRKQRRQPAISEKQWSEHSMVGEKDRADANANAGYGSEESWPRREKGVRRVGGLWE